jgi:hypothetical protein
MIEASTSMYVRYKMYVHTLTGKGGVVFQYTYKNADSLLNYKPLFAEIASHLVGSICQYYRGIISL